MGVTLDLSTHPDFYSVGTGIEGGDLAVDLDLISRRELESETVPRKYNRMVLLGPQLPYQLISEKSNESELDNEVTDFEKSHIFVFVVEFSLLQPVF